VPATQEIERLDALNEREVLNTEQGVRNGVQLRQVHDFAADLADEFAGKAIFAALAVFAQAKNAVVNYEVVDRPEKAVFITT